MPFVLQEQGKSYRSKPSGSSVRQARPSRTQDAISTALKPSSKPLKRRHQQEAGVYTYSIQQLDAAAQEVARIDKMTADMLRRLEDPKKEVNTLALR